MTLLFGVAGAAIGRIYGGTWIGLQIGATIGSLLDAGNSETEVGKLSDLKYSGSSYGSVIPRLWGAGRIAGTVVWVSNDADGNHLVAHQSSQRVGGKKGGSVKQTRYSATFAVAFCEGTLYTPEIPGRRAAQIVHRSPVLKKVYADDKLIWEAGNDHNVALTWHPGYEDAIANRDAVIVAKEGAQTPSFCGLAYAVFQDLDLADFSNRIPNISAEIETNGNGIESVAADICGLAGLHLNVTGDTRSVRGVGMSSAGQARSLIQDLALYSSKDLIEVDGALCLASRGQAPVVAIEEKDLGASDGEGQTAKVKITRALESELPTRMDIAYADVGRSFQQTTQSMVRQTSRTENLSSLSLNVALSAAEARALTARLLDESWTEQLKFEFSLPPKYLYLAAGDVVTVPFEGSDYRVRITEMELAPLGAIQIRGVLDDADNLLQSVSANSGIGTQPQTMIQPGPLHAFAVAGVATQRDELGRYIVSVGACGTNWAGANVYYSLDGANYVYGVQLTQQASLGALNGSLSTVSSKGFQASQAVNVKMTHGELVSLGGTPSGAQNPLLTSSANNLLVANEIVQFENASPATPGEFSLSGLYRGLLDSEISAHGMGTPVMLIDDAVGKFTDSAIVGGKNLWLKFVAPGQALVDVQAMQLTVGEPAQAQTQVEVGNLSTSLSQHVTRIASAGALGHVRVGQGLSISSDGVLSAISSSGGSGAGTTTFVNLAWSVSRSYSVGDLVTGSDGNIYRALQANTGVDPVGENGTRWRILYLFSDLTLGVGTGQRFSTLDAALGYLQSASWSRGVRAILQISGPVASTSELMATGNAGQLVIRGATTGTALSLGATGRLVCRGDVSLQNLSLDGTGTGIVCATGAKVSFSQCSLSGFNDCLVLYEGACCTGGLQISGAQRHCIVNFGATLGSADAPFQLSISGTGAVRAVGGGRSWFSSQTFAGNTFEPPLGVLSADSSANFIA